MVKLINLWLKNPILNGIKPYRQIHGKCAIKPWATFRPCTSRVAKSHTKTQNFEKYYKINFKELYFLHKISKDQGESLQIVRVRAF